MLQKPHNKKMWITIPPNYIQGLLEVKPHHHKQMKRFNHTFRI